MSTHTIDHIICRVCHQAFDPAERVVSAHHTSAGVIRYVRCPAGHLSVVTSHTAPATPLAACA